MLSFSQDNCSGGEGGVAVATGVLQSPRPAAGAPSAARGSTGQEHDLHYHYQISLIFVILSTDLIALSPSVVVMSVLVRFLSACALLSDPGADGGAAQAEGAAVQD